MSNDHSTQEVARITADFRSHLTGDAEHDSALRRDFAEHYRAHPLAREIAREIARVRFEQLLDAAFDNGMTQAERQFRTGDAEGARQTLEGLIERFDASGASFADDAVSEYRVLPNPYEAGLYRRLFQPTRTVRGLPYDLFALNLLYGLTLVELGDLDTAERALNRARTFNPVNIVALFELGEVFKMQRRWKEFHEVSTFALSVSSSGEQAARAYRNLGFHATEQGDYDLATACYQKSGLIDQPSAARCAEELRYIEQRSGTRVAPPDDESVDQTLHANGIQTVLNDMVREAVAEADASVDADIFETVRNAMLASKVAGGEPQQLAALLLSCAGRYRGHPRTPGVLRRISWMLADQAPPDLKAKLSLAVMRLAEMDGTPDGNSVGMGFIDDLHLWATQSGPTGSVGVTHTESGRVVAQYDWADSSLAVNSDLTAEGSHFPHQTITDAMELAMIYVDDMTAAEAQTIPPS